jgi:hypothetical protein
MGILSSVIVGTGIKGLGLAASAAGSVVTAAGSLAKGIAGGIKSGGDAAQDEQSSTNSVINNVGMAGSAGTQRVATGGGTLPAPKKAARPAYNEKMPTEKLLMVAVGYLSSIDNTLRTQLQNDRVVYQKQVQAEKETAVENKKSGAFSRLGNKFGFMNKKPSAGMAKKLLIGGALLAGLGAIGISKLDTTELDALKSNVAAFKTEYKWLVELGSFIGISGFLGFLRGGVKGGLVGMVGAYVVDKLWHSPLNPYAPKDENGNLIKASGGAAGGALAAGAGAYMLRSSLKKRVAGAVGGKALEIVTRPNYATMSAGGRAGARKAGLQGAGKATAWFASRGGRRFLIMLQRRLGKKVMQKIAGILARIVGGILLTATGPGAIVGIAVMIFNTGLLLSGIYDIATAIWETYQDWKDTKDVDKVSAVPVAGETVSGVTTPSTSGAEASGTPDTAYDVILGYGKYGKPEDYYNGRKLTQLTVAEVIEFGRNVLQPRSKADGVGVSTSGKLLGDSGVGAYQTNRTTIQGAIDAGVIAPNELYDKTAQDKVAKWLYNQRNKAGNLNNTWAYFNKSGQRSSSMSFEQSQPYIMAGEGTSGKRSNTAAGGGSLGGLFESGKAIFGKAGGALIGAQNYMPSDSGKNATAKITNMSKQIETAMTVGNKQDVAKASPAISAAQKSVTQASNDGSLSALDPNYPGTGDTVMKYLAHWKFAA